MFFYCIVFSESIIYRNIKCSVFGMYYICLKLNVFLERAGWGFYCFKFKYSHFVAHTIFPQFIGSISVGVKIDLLSLLSKESRSDLLGFSVIF